MDIVEFLPEPEQPVVYPPIPEWHIPEVVKVEPQPNSFHDKKMRDSNPRFPFHIDIIADQVERWKNEFHLNLSDAFLCRYNLQREFKAVGIRLHYCIVLLSEEEYPANFINLKNQASPDVVLLDDDFILAYLQKPEYNWRDEWHVESVSSIEELPSCVEFNNRVPLLNVPATGSIPDAQNGIIQDVKFLRDVIKESIKAEMEAGQDEKMPTVLPPPKPIEDFIWMISPDVLLLYAAVKSLHGKKALEAALSWLENNPCQNVLREDLSTDTFNYTEKPERAYPTKIMQAVLIRNGYLPLGQEKIKKILSKP